MSLQAGEQHVGAALLEQQGEDAVTLQPSVLGYSRSVQMSLHAGEQHDTGSQRDDAATRPLAWGC